MIEANNPYFERVKLLVRVLPAIAAEECFALKGGTAINLIFRDLPRLSVDIDLAYLPINDRSTALREIDAAMRRIETRLSSAPYGMKIQHGTAQDGMIVRLYVAEGKQRVVIEVTPVLRGTVYPPEVRATSAATQDVFGFAEINCVSFEDLYAGKLMAALDRQHPRDLFDVKLLMESDGINDRLFQAFLVYLISHDRPMTEVLFPPRKPLQEIFEGQFRGMTSEPVELSALETARESLIAAIHARLDESTRKFLLGFKSGNPDWSLLSVPHARDLPAVKWKLLNLEKMSKESRAASVAHLEAALRSVD